MSAPAHKIFPISNMRPLAYVTPPPTEVVEVVRGGVLPPALSTRRSTARLAKHRALVLCESRDYRLNGHVTCPEQVRRTYLIAGGR